MRHLWIGIEVLDFDLEEIGFFFNVLNPDTKEPKSSSYLRMSLVELGVFINALKASAANIKLSASNSIIGKSKINRLPGSSSDNPLPDQDFAEHKNVSEMTYTENIR